MLIKPMSPITKLIHDVYHGFSDVKRLSVFQYLFIKPCSSLPIKLGTFSSLNETHADEEEKGKKEPNAVRRVQVGFKSNSQRIVLKGL